MRTGHVRALIDALVYRESWPAQWALAAIVGRFQRRARVYYNGEWYRPNELFKNFVRLKAYDVNLVFWGGPPNNGRWRDGTLLDYLADSCYKELAKKDPHGILFDFLDAATREKSMWEPAEPILTP